MSLALTTGHRSLPRQYLAVASRWAPSISARIGQKTIAKACLACHSKRPAVTVASLDLECEREGYLQPSPFVTIFSMVQQRAIPGESHRHAAEKELAVWCSTSRASYKMPSRASSSLTLAFAFASLGPLTLYTN